MSSPYAVSVNKNNNYKFAGIDFTLSNGFSSATDIITLKFRTLKTGSTTLSLANVLLNDCNNNKLSVTPVSKTITIGTPVIKDSNNYLSALSITGYTISPAFNKNTTIKDNNCLFLEVINCIRLGINIINITCNKSHTRDTKGYRIINIYTSKAKKAIST